MEQKNKKYPFPQANDFNKILLLLNIDNESLFNDKEYLKIYLDLGTERQISYYLSAFQFLGLIDDEKKFTSYSCCADTQLLSASSGTHMYASCKFPRLVPYPSGYPRLD